MPKSHSTIRQRVIARLLHKMVVFSLLFPICVSAQSKTKDSVTTPPDAERSADLQLQSARSNPLQLRHFLLGMPKGADLHNHLPGAIYAESWIRAGVEDRLCINLEKLAFAKPRTAANGGDQETCDDGQVPASNAVKDQELYDALVDAFSMRGFVPSSGTTAHDHFFDAFDKFITAYDRHLGEWLDEVATRAAAQNEQYLELMHTPDFSHSAALAKEVGWNDDLAHYRQDLLSKGLRDDLAPAKAALDAAEALRQNREHCAQTDATPACRVEIRYLCQVLRGLPKEVVFAQTLLCFEGASADPRFVGINLVMPEDGYVSTSDYALHMRMVGFLHDVYPRVHISLHAGELVPGLVPYESLCCHIRLAVEQAHAERIGHGVDIMYEDHPHELMKEMAGKHILVEISLTSNDIILGIVGKDHPFPLYRLFAVPVALSTDDEGVSRIDLTNEYVRAVDTYDLHYRDLKQMIRAGLEHSFLPGASLWHAQDVFTRTVSACAIDSPGADKPSAPCDSFLNSSEKAAQQWELERRFHTFESR